MTSLLEKKERPLCNEKYRRVESLLSARRLRAARPRSTLLDSPMESYTQ